MQKDLLENFTQEKHHFKHFHVLCAIYIAGMILSLTVSARLFPFHIPLSHFTILLTAGTWTIPISFFIQDITTEVYGYEKSRHLVQMTLIILIVYIFYLKLTNFLPTPQVNTIETAYIQIFDTLPRHLIALLAATVMGNLINDYLLSRSKVFFKGKYLPLRFIGSTAVGEAALQLTGTLIAWFGSLHFTTEILPFVIFSYLYKIAFEIAITPINIRICRWLKKSENIDAYDFNTNYNPFRFTNQNKREL